jgi:hypothetical protein
VEILPANLFFLFCELQLHTNIQNRKINYKYPHLLSIHQAISQENWK